MGILYAPVGIFCKHASDGRLWRPTLIFATQLVLAGVPMLCIRLGHRVTRRIIRHSRE